MKKHFLFLALTCVGFISCQKEIAELPDGTSPTEIVDSIPAAENGGLLTRLVWTSENATDSFVFKFKYDITGRIIEIGSVLEGTPSPGVELSSYKQVFERNSEGIVENIILKTYLFHSGNNPQLHWDVVCRLKYDNNSGQYQYGILTGTGENNPVYDSLVYRYNDDKQIEVVDEYNFSNEDDTMRLGDRFEYVYNPNGNIANQKATESYGYPNRRDWYNFTMEYDDQINPLNFGEEILLLGEGMMISLPTPNNSVKGIELVYGEGDYTVQYIYNTHKKPITANRKNIAGENVRINYYYQK